MPTEHAWPSAPPLPERASRADLDPRWVWTAARWTAGVFLAALMTIAIALIVMIAVDIRAAQSPDHTNDDGTGAGLFVGMFGLVLLAPFLAISVIDTVLAALRSRVALVLHAIGGCLGTFVALLAAAAGQAWALLLVPVSGVVAALAINGLAATTRSARRAARR